MENIKLSSFTELSTEEMYATDGGGWIRPLLPVVVGPILWWLIRK